MNHACERLTVFLNTPIGEARLGPNQSPAHTQRRIESPLNIQDFVKECELLYSCFSRYPDAEVLAANDKTPKQNLDARRYSYAHTIRVFHYALFLAQSTNQPPEVIRAIGKAALAHDIGKSVDELVSVHDYNTDKLDKDYNKPLMDRHVEFSLKIAKTAGLDVIAIEAIAYHHERWDGEGYPNRISGGSIPISAIILSMADIFDSAVSKRPYNGHKLNNMSFDEVVADLREKLFNNSKFNQDKLEWFEILANNIKEGYAKELHARTTKFAEEVII